MTAPAHKDDEPAGPGPVMDDAEQQRIRAAWASWSRRKRQAAIEQGGPYPVGADGLEVGGELLTAWLRGAYPPAGE